MDDTSSDKTNQIDTQTSQQKQNAYSLAEGISAAGVSDTGSGDEFAPTGIPTTVAISQENQLKTTQMLRGEYSLAEGDSKSSSEGNLSDVQQ